jgi:septal ring factor EnvC (AmiA/AmiB activator)
MKSVPILLLMLVSLGLCAVSVAQWRREAVFRQRLVEADALVQDEREARREATDRAASFEREIARLTQLRADTEAKLVEVTDSLNAAQKALAGAAATADDRARSVEAHNAAITEANARLQQVTEERDRALAELNERTRAYNELMTKNNKGGR